MAGTVDPDFKYPDHDGILVDMLKDPGEQRRGIAKWLILEERVPPARALKLAAEVYLSGLEIFCLRPMTLGYLDNPAAAHAARRKTWAESGT